MGKIKHFTLIIGAMKSGTTSLFSYLAQHPEICPSAEKEPMFFSRPTWEGGMAAYEKLWKTFDKNTHKIALEASTEYSKIPTYPNTADRILQYKKKYDVEFKFIYIIRDPLDMIASGLKHGQDAGWGSTRKELFDHLINVTNYAMQASKYYEHFPEENILIVKFDDLINKPSHVVYQVIKFLKLDCSFQFTELRTIFNSQQQRKTSQYEDKLKNNISNIKLVRYASRLLPSSIKIILKPFAYSIARKFYPEPVQVKKEEWQLTEPEKQYVIEKFRPSLRQLEIEYGLDLANWKTR